MCNSNLGNYAPFEVITLCPPVPPDRIRIGRPEQSEVLAFIVMAAMVPQRVARIEAVVPEQNKGRCSDVAERCSVVLHILSPSETCLW